MNELDEAIENVENSKSSQEQSVLFVDGQEYQITFLDDQNDLPTVPIDDNVDIIIDHNDIIIENINPVQKFTDEQENGQLLVHQDGEAAEVDQRENNEEVSQNDDIVKKQLKPRKRQRDPTQWKLNKRSKSCQGGQEYLSVRGKLVKARSIANKKDCLNSCKFQCDKQVSAEEKQQFFDAYWSLSQNEKYVLLGQLTTKLMKARKTKEGPSRRQFSYKYFIKTRGETIRVCKNFFLGTLNISQKPIYTAHSNGDTTPKKDNRGKTSSRAISENRKKDVMNHINLFPVVESHYCRRVTKRKYLESNLSVAKMYDMYVKWCAEQQKTPVLLSMYRRIFVTEYNYGFHIPKKDRCIKCESYKLKKLDNILTEEDKTEHDQHILIKNAMRKERNTDREKRIPVLSFDLENVITCPRTDVGDFFYLPKFTIYNLTGYFSLTGVIYCAIWTELQQGRGGNILASAFRAILDRVLQDNNISDLVTWSDSCVPQNRNSIISFAVMDALRDNPDLKSLTMKYSFAGHGAIQEVDNVHSNIEKYMNKTEFYSPLSFIRNLKSVNKRKPYVILQLKDKNFKDFESCAKNLAFKNIPFTKVASIKFTQNLSEVEYKTNHSQTEFIKGSLRNEVATSSRENLQRSTKKSSGKVTKAIVKKKEQATPRRSNTDCTQSLIMTLKPKVLPIKNTLSIEKKNSIKKMINSCMPAIDKQYFLALFNNTITIKKN